MNDFLYKDKAKLRIHIRFSSQAGDSKL